MLLLAIFATISYHDSETAYKGNWIWIFFANVFIL